MGFSQKANLGKAWEQRLDFWHHAYQRDRLAVVVQTTPPTVVRKADGSVRRVGTGAVDFLAIALGLPVAFDAKDTKAERWALQNLKPHQALQLETWHACGGVSFVALQIRERPYVVDWGALGPRWWEWKRTKGRAKPGDASLDREWLKANAWPMPRDGWIGYVRERRKAMGLDAYVPGESRWLRPA